MIPPEACHLGGYGFTDMSLSAPGEPAEMARGLRVSTTFFAMRRVAPRLGRGFRPDESVLGVDQRLAEEHG